MRRWQCLRLWDLPRSDEPPDGKAGFWHRNSILHLIRDPGETIAATARKCEIQGTNSHREPVDLDPDGPRFAEVPVEPQRASSDDKL